MAPPDVMLGTWKLVRQENFDEYLTYIGSGHLTRAMSDLSTWSLVIDKLDDDVFKLSVQSTLKAGEIVFRIDGREIEEVTGDGRICRSVMAWDEENGILVQKRIGLDGCKGGLLTRQFKGDEMELFLKVDDLIARRVYKRVEKKE